MQKHPNKKNVLICPLDWGLGHATRSVPIIKELLKQNFNVIIGADNKPLDLLKIEFPNLKFVPFSGIKISYPANHWMALKMFLSIPKFLFGVHKEHLQLKKIIAEHNINIVISDNRYGLWNKKVHSVFITHQIGIKTPSGLAFLKPILLAVNKFFIHKYDKLWVPDFKEEPNLSGSLAHGYKIKIPTTFIGPLSRFTSEEPVNPEFEVDIMAIISGPEPQRSIFEKQILDELKSVNLKCILLKGNPDENTVEEHQNIKVFSHLPTPAFQSYFKNAKLILSRSGYCTLMDMAIMNKKAIIIPTPGQTEQIYLAKTLHAKKIYFSQSQNEFSIREALNKCSGFKGIQLETDYSELIKEIRLFASI